MFGAAFFYISKHSWYSYLCPLEAINVDAGSPAPLTRLARVKGCQA